MRIRQESLPCASKKCGVKGVGLVENRNTKCIFGGFGGGCGVGWGQKRSSALRHILDDMLLETSFPAHTHIFPTTLETFSLALTHLKDRMSYGDLLLHKHTYFMLCYKYFVLHMPHAHILPVSLYTSFLALTHILEATPHRHLFLHIHTDEKTSWFKEALPCKTQWNGTMGLQSPRDFQGANLKSSCGAMHI